MTMIPPISDAEARITHLRGTGLAHFRATLKVSLFGGRWETLLARLSPGARALLERPPDPETWVPSELLHEIHLAQADLPHADTRRVRGQLTAEAEVTRSHLLDGVPPGDPRPLIRQFPAHWQVNNRGGCITVDRLDDGVCELSAWATFPYMDYLRDVGPAWMVQALTMAGARNPRVDYLGPGPDDVPYRHRYWLAWTPQDG